MINALIPISGEYCPVPRISPVELPQEFRYAFHGAAAESHRIPSDLRTQANQLVAAFDHENMVSYRTRENLDGLVRDFIDKMIAEADGPTEIVNARTALIHAIRAESRGRYAFVGSQIFGLIDMLGRRNTFESRDAVCRACHRAAVADATISQNIEKFCNLHDKPSVLVRINLVRALKQTFPRTYRAARGNIPLVVWNAWMDIPYNTNL